MEIFELRSSHQLEHLRLLIRMIPSAFAQDTRLVGVAQQRGNFVPFLSALEFNEQTESFTRGLLELFRDSHSSTRILRTLRSDTDAERHHQCRALKRVRPIVLHRFEVPEAAEGFASPGLRLHIEKIRAELLIAGSGCMRTFMPRSLDSNFNFPQYPLGFRPPSRLIVPASFGQIHSITKLCPVLIPGIFRSDWKSQNSRRSAKSFYARQVFYSSASSNLRRNT